MSDTASMRNTQICNLRVLAVLIVVLGHAIIIFDPDWSAWCGYSHKYSSEFLCSLKHVINSFQMELFFAVSGFCFYYSFGRLSNGKSFVYDKLKRLLIPFVVVGICWLIPLRYLAHYIGYENLNLFNIIKRVLLVQDAGHLWFLPVLFCVFMIALGVRSLRWNVKILPLIVASCCFVIHRYIPNFIISQAMKYLIFFEFGYYINTYGLFNSRRVLWFGIIGFVGVAILIGLLSVKSVVPEIIVRFIIATFFVAALFLLIPNKTMPFIGILDRNSFGIYLFHSPILYIGMCYLAFLPPPIYIFLQLTAAIIVSLMLTVLLRRCHCHFIIGEKYNGK